MSLLVKNRKKPNCTYFIISFYTVSWYYKNTNNFSIFIVK